MLTPVAANYNKYQNIKMALRDFGPCMFFLLLLEILVKFGYLVFPPKDIHISISVWPSFYSLTSVDMRQRSNEPTT